MYRNRSGTGTDHGEWELQTLNKVGRLAPPYAFEIQETRPCADAKTAPKKQPQIDVEPNQPTEDIEDDIKYPSRIRLAFLTIGLMAIVLMVALDNYILGV